MPIRVAHVITRLDVGGAQETVVRICAGLDRSRFQPVILTGPDEGSGGTLHAAAADKHIPVITVRNLCGPIRPGRDLRCMVELSDKLRRLRPDIVHTNSSKAGVIGRIAARRARVPHVVHTVHGWSFNDFQPVAVSRTYQEIERRLARITDALVVVTDVDRDLGLELGIGRRSQYVLVRSGIPLDPPTTADRTQVRSSMGWSDDDRVILSVGRLERQKDPLALIEAMGIVARSVPAARLVLVGGGSLTTEVTSLATARGIAPRVDILGVRDDVAGFLVGCDLFASAARWEGMPRTIIEAAAAGVPIAATDVGGVGEVIEDDVSGRLARPADPQGLAGAILDLLDDPDRAQKMADAASSKVSPFSDTKMVSDTTDLYDRLARHSG